MHLIGKVGSVMGAIGIVGGGVAAVNHFYKGFRNVSERLTGAGFKVLDINGDASEWQTVETAYTQESRADKKFKETLTTAKENCKIALQNNPSDASAYPLASKWCVKVETMEQMLTRNEYTKLTKVPADTTNKEKWQEKIESLKKYSGEEKINIDFTKTVDEQIAELQGECDKITAETIKTHNTDDFEKKFIQAKEWCATKNSL
ncbi:hypothetical protein A6V39_00705 [Candidatus Mycoplasma haematobovis]|uniref:Uncharacterized protein n=1 Tax=Candidatus Mycoplasma haematobovis TaxID=432608 RepID=A0A1A9QEY5_9MOLU|nr:hypothetical protein [Candidatus Mycoplasma haematobovis]OAL10571.1 hypothetical protein A6V39_00705 [Candidatus Mycoplasma haematobovis]